MVIMTVQAVPRLIEEQGLVLERYCDAVDGLGFGMTKSMVKVQAYSLLEEAYLAGTQWAVQKDTSCAHGGAEEACQPPATILVRAQSQLG
jgi:hypothetical protein